MTNGINGKYKSLADFYKFGFGRYPGFHAFYKSRYEYYRYASTLASLGDGLLVDMKNTAAVHACHPIESDRGIGRD